jgi:hypothetical protein
MGHFKLVDNQLQSVALMKKTSSISLLHATDSVVYVLYSDKTLEMLKADNIEESLNKTDKLQNLGSAKGEATTFTYVEKNDEIWIGDNKGFIHVLDGQTLKLKAD